MTSQIEMNLMADEYETIASCARKLSTLSEPQRVRVVRALDSMLVKRMIEPIDETTINHLKRVQTIVDQFSEFTAQESGAVKLAIKILSHQVVGND